MNEHDKLREAIGKYNAAIAHAAKAKRALYDAERSIDKADQELVRVINSTGGKPVILDGRRYQVRANRNDTPVEEIDVEEWLDVILSPTKKKGNLT